MRKSKRNRMLILVLSVLVSTAFCILTHVFDNKYYNRDPGGISGISFVSREEAQKTVSLVSGWEFYRYRLLTPEDFTNGRNVPDAYVSIGEYKGFELWDNNGDPHGQATYRMTLLLDSNPLNYKLELPEIFSAYYLYINGKLLYQSGNPQVYSPRVAATTITFEAAEKAEIIIAAADFSHYYSGLVYPPAFGTEEAVSRLLDIRQFVIILKLLFAFIMAVSYMVIYFKAANDKRNLIFSLMCAAYLLYGSYPVIHSFVPVTNEFWYRIEDIGFILLLTFTAALVNRLCNYNYRGKLYIAVIVLSSSMLIAAVLVPMIQTKNSLAVLVAYGYAMDFYKLSIFAYLISGVLAALWQGQKGTEYLAPGILFFAVCLAFDRGGLWYEPLLLGWGAENGAFVLCVILAVLLITDMITAKKQVVMLSQQERETRAYVDEVIHDLKSPLFGLTTYTEMSLEGMARDDEEQKAFMRAIDDRARELAKRIERMSAKNIVSRNQLKLTEIESLAYLHTIAEKYHLPAERLGVDLIVAGNSFTVEIDKEKMELAIENLIMNALRFTHSGGKITLEARVQEGTPCFLIRDTGEGIDEEYVNMILKRGVSFEEKHSGLGLAIVSDIAAAHGGSISLESKKGQGTTFIVKLK